MTPLSQANMVEATRLTREGRLAEARALLQGAAPAAPAPGSTSDATASGPRSPLIDMVPPSAGSAGAWTAPDQRDAVPPKRRARAAPLITTRCQRS